MGEFDELTRLATTQGGFVTAGQALRLGLGREQIRYLVRSGRWTRVSRGCYLPSPAGPTPVALRRATIRATIASLGQGAVAVLGTAAELHGIAGLPPTPVIHVSVPSDRPHVQRRPEPGLTVHQLTLAEADVCRAGGVPVTTPARTVAEQYHAEGLNERPAGAGHMRCVQHDRNANSLRVKHESGVTGTPRAPATPPP